MAEWRYMEYLTPDDLSELLELPQNQVILAAKRGEIPAYVICGKLRFDANEVEAWVKQHRLKPGVPTRLKV